MLILGIESSCDDTSVALLNCSKKGCFVIKEITASQIDIHKKYGGVVPEIAGRAHAEKIVPLIEDVTNEIKKLRNKEIKPDAIAVTAGPGLITGLLVGVEAARTLSYAWNIPLVGVNHIEGHIHSVEISNFQFSIFNSNNKLSRQSVGAPRNDIAFPALCLVASGGHTELILMKDRGKYKLLGATRDDAAGECFDKVAKLLGLPYPGGPQISKLAEEGKTGAIKFPRPMIGEKNFDFSFAGLKTSALYWLRDNRIVIPTTKEESLSQSTNGPRSPACRQAGSSPASLARDDKDGQMTIEDFCASFEQAIIDVLVSKTLRAAEKYKPKSIILAGGVSANKKLRLTLQEQIASNFPISNFLFPLSNYCMDNAAMIAAAGYYHALKKDFTGWKKLKADPNWRLA